MKSRVKEIVCTHCEGTGIDTDYGVLSEEPCVYCNGTGLERIELTTVAGVELRVIYPRD